MSARVKTLRLIKLVASLICLLVLMVAAAPTFADTALEPGKVITFTFPELPPTLYAMKNPTASRHPSISVRLPDNYARNRSFPLFVYLQGGWGNIGSEVQRPMAIVGKNDYIVASFPLFKSELDDPEESWGGIGMESADGPTISRAFKAMVDRIRVKIPNIDPQTSILGGYSNGANTLAVLLSAADPSTLKSFKRFYFIDAGMEWSSYARYKTLGDHDILYVVGGGTSTPEWWRKYLLSRVAYYKEVAEQLHMSRWKFVVVDGAGHEDPTKYFAGVRDWAAGK